MENNLDELNLIEESIVRYGSVKSYRELIVWRKSMELVNEIYNMTRSFPDDEKFGLTSQVRRAAISIPSNIAEGWGRNSKGSYMNHLKIANGSCCELETQLLIVKMLKYSDNIKIDSLINLNDECGKMLRSLIRKMESSNN